MYVMFVGLFLLETFADWEILFATGAAEKLGTLNLQTLYRKAWHDER
jgi:hypothetical protein